MIDPVLGQILATAFKYGVGCCVIGGILRLINKGESGPSLSQTLAISFLIGGTFGAIIGMFASILDRS